MGNVFIPGSVMLYTWLQNISIEAKNVYPVNYFTQAIKNTLYIKNILVNTSFWVTTDQARWSSLDTIRQASLTNHHTACCATAATACQLFALLNECPSDAASYMTATIFSPFIPNNAHLPVSPLTTLYSACTTAAFTVNITVSIPTVTPSNYSSVFFKCLACLPTCLFCLILIFKANFYIPIGQV